MTLSNLTTSHGVLESGIIDRLIGMGYPFNPLTATFTEYLAEVLSDRSQSPASNLLLSENELLAGVVNELTGGSASHLTLSRGELLALLYNIGQTAVSYALTASNFGNAEWTSTNKLRWAPPTLVNPLEPGTVRDETKPGTGIKTIIPTSFQAWSIPLNQDALVVGSQHVAAGTRTGQFQPSGGRRVIIRGFESNAQRLIVSNSGSEHWFIEGVRGDRTLETAVVIDSLFSAGNGAIYTFQNIHFRGVKGTDRNQFFGGVPNSATIISITKAAGVISVELAAAFPEGDPVAGRDVIIGLSSFAGDASPLKNFNYTWQIGTVTDSTHFTLVKNKDNVLPADGTSATGGTAWMMQTTVGTHADAIQLNQGNTPIEFRVDKCTFKVNSRGIIVQSLGPKYKFSRTNTDLDLSLNPQDHNTFTFWGGSGYDMEFYEFWIETRDLPNGLGKRGLANNINPAGSGGEVLGKLVAYFPAQSSISGVMNQGRPPTDFANYDDLGVAYVSPGYGDMPAPTAVAISDIAIDNIAIPAGAAENTHIAWMTVEHTTVGQIIDVHISSGDTTRFKMLGSELACGAVATDNTSYTVELTATIRGTAITFAKSFLIIAGLVVDLDAANGVTATGGLVDSWDGRSGTIYDAAGTGATRPTLGVTDDVSVVKFNGAHEMDIPGLAAAWPTTGYTIAARLKFGVVGSASREVFGVTQASSAVNRHRIDVLNSLISTSASVAHRKSNASSDGVASWAAGGASANDNMWRSIVAYSDTGTVPANLTVDGINAGTPNSVLLAYGFTVATLGARKVSGVSGAFGIHDLARFMVFDRRLTVAEIAAITAAISPASQMVFQINAGDDVNAIVQAAPESATFNLSAGTYRQQQIVPKNNQRFFGALGAILNGSEVLTGWTADGADWWVGGQTQQGQIQFNDHPAPGAMRAGYPETCFRDNVPLLPADSRANLAPGYFFLDYDADRIYVRDDPAGHVIEAGKGVFAFDSTATGVVIQNLVIEKYNAPAQHGGIHGRQNWTILDNEVRLCYGVGIYAEGGSTISGNYVHDNGNMGIGTGLEVGGELNILVEDNEIASNGAWSGIDVFWEGGGTKFRYSDGLIVRGNYSHDNTGYGLWTDIDNINALIEDNAVIDNSGGGIVHEISYAAVIRNNILMNNGAVPSGAGWVWGGNIQIQNAKNVEVYGNRMDYTTAGNGLVMIYQNRGGDYTVTGNNVHDNIFVSQAGLGRLGGSSDFDGPALIAGGNLWADNDYFMPAAGTASERFIWGAFDWESFASFQTATGENGTLTQDYPDTAAWLVGSAADPSQVYGPR